MKNETLRRKNKNKLKTTKINRRKENPGEIIPKTHKEVNPEKLIYHTQNSF